MFLMIEYVSGEVNIQDVISVVSWILNLNDQPPCESEYACGDSQIDCFCIFAADPNGDGMINIGDVMAVVNQVLTPPPIKDPFILGNQNCNSLNLENPINYCCLNQVSCVCGDQNAESMDTCPEDSYIGPYNIYIVYIGVISIDPCIK